MEMEVESKFELVTSNLAEVIGDINVLKKILAIRPLKLYWGTAPTGRIHIGYFAAMNKLVDYQRAGCDLTILLADRHAIFDNEKSTREQIPFRTEIYRQVIEKMFEIVGGDASKLTWVVGSQFQRTEEYDDIMTELKTKVSIHDCIKAGAEVVKQTEHPNMASVEYPIMQVADEVYLDVDAQAGGLDQRKIMILGRTMRSKITAKKGPLAKYKKREMFHLMNKMIPSLSTKSLEDLGGSYKKMSASDGSKIDVLDGKKIIKKKLATAFCKPGVIDDNTPLFLLRDIFFPILHRINTTFKVTRKEEYGGDIEFETFSEVQEAFEKEKLHPDDLKNSMVVMISSLLEPIRNLEEKKDFRDLLKKAYK